MEALNGPALLIGYDFESCAIGEDLGRIEPPAQQLREAVESTSTASAAERVASLHTELGIPATVFACGKTVLHELSAFETLAATGLIDIQQHTYSHVLFKDDAQLGTTFPASPTIALEFEIRMASAVLREHLDIECIGMRTPHGYRGGLADRPDLIRLVAEAGIRYVSSWIGDRELRGRTAYSPEASTVSGATDAGDRERPGSLANQPRWYDVEDGPPLLELPISALLDVTWFEQHGLTTGEAYLGELRAELDVAIETRAVYGTAFHDWAVPRYHELETGYLRGLFEYALERDVPVMSYTGFYERATSEA